MARLSNAYQAVLRSAVRSSKLGRVSHSAECTFMRLLLTVDGEGRSLGDPFDLCAQLDPHRARSGQFGTPEMTGWLGELEGVGLLFRYVVDDENYVQVVDYFDAGNSLKTRFPGAPEGFIPQQGIAIPYQGHSIPLEQGTGNMEQGAGNREQRARNRDTRVRVARPTLDSIIDEVEQAGGPAWSFEVMREYLEARKEVALGVASKMKTPTTLRGWKALGLELQEAGEVLSRQALRMLISSEWDRLSNALRAAQEQAGKPNRKETLAERPHAQARDKARKRVMEESDVWLTKRGIDDA